MADITIVNGVYKPTNITGGHHPIGGIKTPHKNPNNDNHATPYDLELS